tara:strand:+ start:1449 stop:3314 length:1866 start_codon:yes stop_codon:yes gene_type:complete
MATDYSAGTPWDYAKKNPSGNIVDKELDWQDFGRDDIVGQELNRPSSAFTKVQRYPGGYGSSSAPSGPSKPGGFGGGGFGSGSFTFNPTFNVTSSNVNTAGGGGGAIGSITDSTVGDIETGADTTTKGPIKTTSAESGTTAANTFLENITDSVISDTANPIQTPIVTASNQAPSSIAAALTNQTSDTATNQNIPDNLGTITNTGETTSTTTQTAENTATSTQNLNETAQELINEIEKPQGQGGGGTETGTGTGTGGTETETGGGTTVTNIHADPFGTKIEPPEPKVPGIETNTGQNEGSSGTPELIDKYNLILGREPDEEGLQYWEDELATRTAAGEDRGDVLDNITASFQAGDEFLNRELAQQLDNQIVPDEDRLDAWIGPGGGLTQSSNPTGQTYYEGVGSLKDYVDPDTGGAADKSTEDLFGLYEEFGRNPDEAGLEYWEDELATRTAAGEDYDDVLANIGQSFEDSAEAELRDTLSSGQDLSATQDLSSTPIGLNPLTQEQLDEALAQLPTLTPADTSTTSETSDNPFGTDFPVYSQEELDAIFNPSASASAPAPAPTPAPAPAVKETVPYYNVDFSDPSTYMNKEVDWTADWTKDTQSNNEKPWYEKDLTEFSWFK